MKKLLFVSLFSVFGLQAHADCNLNMKLNKTDIAKYVKYHGGPNENIFTAERYNVLCEKFRKAHAELQITVQATVLDNKSIGWASISVKDRDTAISTNDYGSISTNVDSFASQDRADQLMVLSLLQSLQEWDTVDLALEKLENERKNTRAFLKKK